MRIRSFRPSIRLLVATITVLPVVFVALLLGGLGWSSSARISENLGDQVMSQVTMSVAGEVRNYLGEAMHVSDRYVRRFEAGVLNDPPGQAWERAMLDDLATTPAVASICFGDVDGNATWLQRGQGRIELGRADRGRADGTTEYVVDPQTGAPLETLHRHNVFDPRERPWWKVAIEASGPRWTPVYLLYVNKNSESMIGTGYTRPLLNRDGKLSGVLVIDVTLGALNAFLGRSDIVGEGTAFIIDQNGRLVATSRGRVTDDLGECIAPERSLDPVIHTAGMALAHSRNASRNFRVMIDSAPARVRVEDLHPFPGIDWRVVTVLPETAFLAEAKSVRRRAVGAGIAVAVMSLGIGLLMAAWLSRPIVVMTTHVKRVARGDFSTRLDLRGARELSVLSTEINAMAAGLKERMELEQSLAVAKEVQQSLLPARDPISPMLDVVGRSKYCDETGGDYFDFIDVSTLSPTSLLVAVGDVTGHGIPAALVMATARAALRTSMLHDHQLANVMNCTNRILSTDNRHKRFMTLLLMRVDAETRTIHWASGGHDPAIVFDPATDSFLELDGADIPLGLVAETEYEQYTSPQLAIQSVVTIGTDGIWEMFNESHEMYGKPRLQQVIRENHMRPSKDIAAALEADLAAFRGKRNPVDDVTFVIIRLLGAEANDVSPPN